MLTTLVIFVCAIGFGLFILYPLLSSPGTESSTETGIDELLLARDQLFHDIRELEFDYRTGKLAEADYHDLLNQLKSQAAAVIDEIETINSVESTAPESSHAKHPQQSEDIEARIAAARKKPGVSEKKPTTCPQCGEDNPVNARFCNSCGAAVAPSNAKESQ